MAHLTTSLITASTLAIAIAILIRVSSPDGRRQKQKRRCRLHRDPPPAAGLRRRRKGSLVGVVADVVGRLDGATTRLGDPDVLERPVVPVGGRVLDVVDDGLALDHLRGEGPQDPAGGRPLSLCLFLSFYSLSFSLYLLSLSFYFSLYISLTLSFPLNLPLPLLHLPLSLPLKNKSTQNPYREQVWITDSTIPQMHREIRRNKYKNTRGGTRNKYTTNTHKRYTPNTQNIKQLHISY